MPRAPDVTRFNGRKSLPLLRGREDRNGGSSCDFRVKTIQWLQDKAEAADWEHKTLPDRMLVSP